MAQSRRHFLYLLIAGALFSSGVVRFLQNRPTNFEFEPIANLPGFRRATAGSISSALSDPFIGLGAGTTARPTGRIGDLHTAPVTASQVPVASFSDFNCPYCRVLTGIVADEAESGSIAVTWHELPLLGPMSLSAAKASLAAGMQGAYLPFHNALMKSRIRPTQPYLMEVADRLGLNSDQLLLDMESAAVADQIQRSFGVAGLLGIFGTPALVIGKTLVMGELSRRDLKHLIDLELSGW